MSLLGNLVFFVPGGFRTKYGLIAWAGFQQDNRVAYRHFFE